MKQQHGSMSNNSQLPHQDRDSAEAAKATERELELQSESEPSGSDIKSNVSASGFG